MSVQDAVAERSTDSGEVWLFALTVFLSAYLLFQVQPLISKLILPWFGGSPAVWTTAMLFFQSVLFGGYLYAHLITRYGSPRVQAGLHIALLAVAAALAMMVVPDLSMKPAGDEEPITRILLLLALSVGLPYFCLATTGPLIQCWFARTRPGDRAFRLYALSNAGSFLALLSFPYVFEPHPGIAATGPFLDAWILGFCSSCVPWSRCESGIRSDHRLPSDVVPTPSGTADFLTRPTVTQRIRWVICRPWHRWPSSPPRITSAMTLPPNRGCGSQPLASTF